MNDNRNDSNLENNSTFDLENDNSYEVKESLFDRIKGFFTRPRLGSGNNVRTTNMDFNSWSMRAVFRRAMENVSNSISSIISKKEPEMKNQFTTTIIGKEEIVQSVEKTADKFSEVTNSRLIPQAKSRTVMQGVQAKGIINNSKSAEDVAFEKMESGLEVADLNVDDVELEIKGKAQEPKSVNSGIKLENIVIDDRKTGKETREDDDERI